MGGFETEIKNPSAVSKWVIFVVQESLVNLIHLIGILEYIHVLDQVLKESSSCLGDEALIMPLLQSALSSPL